MGTKAAGKKRTRKGMVAHRSSITRVLGAKSERAAGDGQPDVIHDHRPAASERKAKAGLREGVYEDGPVRGFTFISGPTGSGKSFESDRLVDKCKRVVKWVPPNVRLEDKGWPVLHQPGELIDFIAANRTNFRCVYVPPPSQEKEAHFEAVVQIVRRAGNCVFVVDEVDQVCSSSAMFAERSAYWKKPENQNRKPAFAELIDTGRHAGIACIFITRFPAQVNTKVRDNCIEMRSFRSPGYNAGDYFRTVDKDIPALMDRLGERQFVLWQEGCTPVIAGGVR